MYSTLLHNYTWRYDSDMGECMTLQLLNLSRPNTASIALIS